MEDWETLQGKKIHSNMEYNAYAIQYSVVVCCCFCFVFAQGGGENPKCQYLKGGQVQTTPLPPEINCAVPCTISSISRCTFKKVRTSNI